MNELFNPLEYSVDWGLLFGLVSILSLVLTWMVKGFKPADKDLMVNEVSIDKLLNKPNELVSDLKILLNGQEIEQLNKIELYVQNYGTKTLGSSDYHVLPKIDLSGFTNIISLSISCSNEFTTCESQEISPSLLELKIENFESKDYLRIEILFESLTNEFESYFEYRLKENKVERRNLKEFGIEKYIGITKDQNAYMMFPLFTGFMVYGLTYFIVLYGLRIDMTDLTKFGLGWKVLYFLPTVLTGLIVILTWDKTFKNFHYGHKKVEKWHFVSLNK